MCRTFWIGKISGMLAVLLILLAAFGVAEAAKDKTDKSKRWKYVLEKDGAKITGYAKTPKGDLVIPGEVDGHPVTAIGDWAFLKCTGITSVTLPDSVTVIGANAFYACRDLTSMTLPEGLISIKDGAFYFCGLTSVTIPASVTSIGVNPFNSCPLKSIGVSPGNPAYEQINGVLFDKRQRKLVSYPGARRGGYPIPEGTLRIGDQAFVACAGLTGVSIPGTVTDIGNAAFSSCLYLTSVTLPDSVTTIGHTAFASCRNLTGINIPHGVTHILFDTFRGAGLTGITLPNSITRIGRSSFRECADLTVTILPDSVTAIDEDAFAGCGQLTLAVEKGSYAEQYAQDNNIAYGEARALLAQGPETGTRLTYALEDGGATITGYTEKPNGDLVIPGELDGHPVTSIGDSAFADCRDLTGVTLPDSVNRIDAEAFARCMNLTHVIIPDSVTAIGEWAFKDCIRLTGVTIGKNVTSIGGLAFFACESLTDVALPDSVTSIGEGAFADCGQLTLTVTEGSAAERYAKDNGVPYVLAAE